MNPCEARADHCQCINQNCDGTHLCECGGSWSGSWGSLDFAIVRFPQRAFTPGPEDEKSA